MYLLSGFETFRNVLPLPLQPYSVVVLIVLAVVLATVFWPILRLILRIRWALRVILVIAALSAVFAVPGCSGQSTVSAWLRRFG